MGRRAGLSNVTLELARAMSDLADVTCYLSKYNELAEEFAQVQCRVRSFQTYTGARGLIKSLCIRTGPRQVARAIQEDAPDVVIDTGSGPWKGLIQGYLRGRIPQAEFVHDVEHHPDRWLVMCHLMDMVSPSRADIRIALSRYSHEHLRRRYPNGANIESRLGVLHPAVDPDCERIASLRNRMLFFGRIEKYKGLDILADAYEKALAANPELKLSVVGQGPVSQELSARMVGMGVNLRNTWIPTEEIPAIISSHGVMVMPYLSATQSAIAAVAMANGMPSIATSTGAMAEQVIDGRNGMIVPPGDAGALAEAMLRIAGDASLALSMSQEALAVAKELYSWDKIAARLLADLGAVVAVRAPGCSMTD
jgi:glycosyltransferase involved in cell wall biosynthesis